MVKIQLVTSTILPDNKLKINPDYTRNLTLSQNILSLDKLTNTRAYHYQY